jgi:hypothetical protein
MEFFCIEQQVSSRVSWRRGVHLDASREHKRQASFMQRFNFVAVLMSLLTHSLTSALGIPYLPSYDLKNFHTYSCEPDASRRVKRSMKRTKVTTWPILLESYILHPSENRCPDGVKANMRILISRNEHIASRRVFKCTVDD